MEQNKQFCLLVLFMFCMPVFILATDSNIHFKTSDYRADRANLQPNEAFLGPSDTDIANWKKSNRQDFPPSNLEDIELVPLPKDVIWKHVGDFNYINAYESYFHYFRDITGQFIFNGEDSLGVWFCPRVKCKIKQVEVLFCDDGSNENLGKTFDIRIFDVSDTLVITDSLQMPIPGNGQYEFSRYNCIVPSPTGRLLGEYQMEVTQTGYNEETGWSVANLEEFGDPIDVGMRDFFISFKFHDGNTEDADVYYGPAEELHAAGDYHSFKYYHDGGRFSPGFPNWVPRLNFTMRVKVEWADVLPPVISPGIYQKSVYYSCDPGPYGVTVYVPWIDTLEQSISAVHLVYYTDDILNADTLEITDNRSVMDNNTVFFGDIPSHPVGSKIWYYFIVENITQLKVRYLKTSPVYINILEASPDAYILVLNDGPYVNIDRYTDVLEVNNWKYDVWDFTENGSPDLCILEHYSSLFWLQGYGTGGKLHFDSLDINILPQYLDNGGNLLLVSSDYLGEALDEGYYPIWPLPVTHPFIAGYLKVNYNNNDANINSSGNSSDSLYMGVEDNFISGFLGTDTLILTPVLIDGHNWADEVTPTDDAEAPFLVYSMEDNDWMTASTMYDGDFKMVFLPWCLETAENQSQFEHIVTNIVRFFNGNSRTREELPVPFKFALDQNYPNPFNLITSIAFEMPKAENVRLTVYNILGHNVRTLVNDQRSAGRYTILWDGRDDAGHMVGSGVYFYQIQAGSFTKTAKMVFLK